VTTGFDLDGAIRRIPNYPSPGILFYDLMPLFQDARGLDACVTGLAEWARPLRPDVIVGIEARGLILAGALAREIGIGLAAARKPGKLPGARISAQYQLEYGVDTLEMHRDAVAHGARVIVHDDLLATGGTAEAGIRLIERLGAQIVGCAFVVDLPDLGGRARLLRLGMEVHALCQFEGK
jgi:adenine phosphoribosyltransferase